MDLALPEIGSFFQGQPIKLVLLFYNASDSLADANDPHLTLYNEETDTAVHYIASDLSRTATGTYTITFSLSEPGTWVARNFDDTPGGSSQPSIITIVRDPAYGR